MIKKIPDEQEFGKIIENWLTNSQNLNSKRDKNIINSIEGITCGFDFSPSHKHESYSITVTMRINNKYVDFPIKIGKPKISNVNEEEND